MGFPCGLMLMRIQVFTSNYLLHVKIEGKKKTQISPTYIYVLTYPLFDSIELKNYCKKWLFSSFN